MNEAIGEQARLLDDGSTVWVPRQLVGDVIAASSFKYHITETTAGGLISIRVDWVEVRRRRKGSSSNVNTHT